METGIIIFLNVLILYGILGLLFGCYFFIKGAFVLDPLIKDSKWNIRALLFPGAAALWPLLLIKIVKTKKRP